MVNIENVMNPLHMMEGNQWQHVVDMFWSEPDIQATKINRQGDTTLHVAVKTSSDDVVARLVGAIRATERVHTLSVMNDTGDTALHAAATRVSRPMCSCIFDCQNSLIMKRNERGETPVFLAAINSHRDAFLYLFHVAAEEDRLSCCRRLNGETVLHFTIKRQYFDMSLLILNLSNEISCSINEKGKSPLEILASTPSVFKSGIQLNWWEKLCFDLRMLRTNTTRGGEVIVQIDHQRENHACAAVSSGLSRILEKTKRYKRLQIMKQLIERDIRYEASIDWDIRGANQIHPISSSDPASYMTRGNPSGPTFPQIRQDKRWGERGPSPLLTATKNGATDLVKDILRLRPYAIDDETRDDKKNIVMVAIEARQSEILTELMKHPSWNYEQQLMYTKDVKKNTALHLAAKCCIHSNMVISMTNLPGELSWFEYVRKLMPPDIMDTRNEEGKTLMMVFVKEHERMMERSDKWVKEMSGNYIVAATLISGVTFATSYQIPGGYSSEEGTPVIEPSTPAFRIFSISALVSFCFSLTSLATFLSIYSSQIEFMQYRRSLPLKLCLGMSTLFISIFSMVLSFCAAHIFELNPRHKSDCVPFYVVLALLPLGFYNATQLQLSWRLLMICFSTVPLPRPLFYIGAERQPEEKVKEERGAEQEQKQDRTRRRRRVRRTRWMRITRQATHT